MKRLSTVIFRNCMIVSLIATVAVLILTMTVFYHDYSAEYKSNLQNEVEVLKSVVEYGGRDELISLDSEHRIIHIDTDGTVIFDNQSEGETLSNHLDREEVAEALDTGEGYAERMSEAVSEMHVYVSVRLSDGTVLRVSDLKPTVMQFVGDIIWIFFIIFAVETIIAFFIALKISRSVTAPINEIDLEKPQEAKVYAELSPLLERIDAQNEQISRQMDDLKREHKNQDEMRRDFTANVSHELKTPLTSISGYAELIKTGIAKEEDVERFAGKIYDESQRLVTLVGDIIKLSQLDGNDIQVEYANIDLYRLCESVVEQLEMSAEKNNVKITLNGDQIELYTATKVVEEIIFNLIDNAIKYNRPNGEVNITVKQCLDGVELSVADTGIGISETELERIFERFYRVDKSHSKEIGGTGLGLSIVKHGARYLGASISVESKLGEGTVVRIVF